MHFAFNDEQLALIDSAKRFLGEHASFEKTLAAMQTEQGFDPQVWTTLTTELGWTALTIPEAYGGYGLSHIDLAALMEEMGRNLLCAPFFSTVCLGANALLVAGSESQKQTHLPQIAAGTRRATLGVIEKDNHYKAVGINTVAQPIDGGFEITGTKTMVIDGHSADTLIIVARQPNTYDQEGIGLYIVPADAAGVERKLVPTIDQTRKRARVVLDHVRVPADALMQGNQSGWPAVTTILNLASIALSAEQVGGAERCLNTAVEYAKIREQFNRPIGSFQAIKHKCADMLLSVESARSVAWYAAWAAAEHPQELAEAAAHAKSYCSEAFFHCAGESIQIHGGIGFTWEHEAHVYFKRAQSSQNLFGAPSFHRERIAEQLGL